MSKLCADRKRVANLVAPGVLSAISIRANVHDSLDGTCFTGEASELKVPGASIAVVRKEHDYGPLASRL